MGDQLVRRETPSQQDNLEGQLERLDAQPMVFPESTPESLPSMSPAQRAQALRRDLRSGPAPLAPSLPPLPPARPAPSRSVTTRPRAPDAARPGSELPSTERPTLPAIPRFVVPAIAALQAEPPVMARQALPSIAPAPSEPHLVVATPTEAPRRKAGQAHLVRLAVVLLGFGTMAFFLLR